MANCKDCRYSIEINDELRKKFVDVITSSISGFKNPDELEKFLEKYKYICILPNAFLPIANTADEFDVHVICEMILFSEKGSKDNDCEFFEAK